MADKYNIKQNTPKYSMYNRSEEQVLEFKKEVIDVTMKALSRLDILIIDDMATTGCVGTRVSIVSIARNNITRIMNETLENCDKLLFPGTIASGEYYFKEGGGKENPINAIDSIMKSILASRC